jgi:ankyrin repeat protein
MSTHDWQNIRDIMDNAPSTIKKLWSDEYEKEPIKMIEKLSESHTLFKYFLENNYFNEALLISHFIPLLEEKNLKIISDRIHSIYEEIIKILSLDFHIILFEQFIHQKTDPLEKYEHHIPFEEYRQNISQRLKECLSKQYPVTNHPVCILIYQFKFLSNQMFKDFNQFLKNYSDVNTYTIKLKSYLKNFCKFHPLIIKLINEYFLHLIKHQINFINEICNGSRIIVKEHFLILFNKIVSIPYEYVTFDYQDRYGYNIPMLLVNLPLDYPDELNQIYMTICSKHFSYSLKNNDKNNIFHLAAIKNNKLLIEHILKNDDITPQMIEIINSKNGNNQTVYDIILSNKHNEMQHNKNIYYPKSTSEILAILIKYVSNDVLEKLIKQIMDKTDLIEMIPEKHNIDHILIPVVSEWISKLNVLRRDILYDLDVYKFHLEKICKLLNKIKLNLNSVHCDVYIKWLIMSIKHNENILIDQLLSKHNHSDDPIASACLTKCHPELKTSILIEAVKMENIVLVKKILSYDVNIFAEDFEQKTAIMYAVDIKNNIIISEILNYLKKINIFKVNKQYHQVLCHLLNRMLIDKTETGFTYNSIFSYWKSFYNFVYQFFYYLIYQKFLLWYYSRNN